MTARMALRDRLWAGASVVTSVGPITPPPRADLVAALRTLAEHGRLTRVGWTQVGDGRRWGSAADLDAFCADAVRELPPRPGETPGDTAERIYALGRGGWPLTIVTCGDSVTMNVAHALADGYHMGRLLHAVIETARTGELPAWATRDVETRPWSNAVWNFFGRHPERVGALRGLVGSRRTEEAASSRDEAVAHTVAARRPWQPSVACVTRASTPAAFRAMKQWRKENAPGVSTASLTFAVAERARVARGHAAAAPPLVLFDARRYLNRRDREVPGNFCAGLYLDVDEPFHPQAFHDEMGRASELGRPLTAMTVGMVRTAMRPRQPETTRPVGAAWAVAHTYMGRPPDIARLPWLDDGRLPYYMGMLTPAGANGVTLACTEIGGRMNVSASFHDNVISRAEVEAVLELMCVEPAALLAVGADRTSRSGPSGPAVAS